MKNKYVLFFVLILLLGSCTQTPQEIDAEIQQQKRIELSENIKALEQGLGNAQSLDVIKGNQLVDAYKAYADACREDSITPHYLFKGADVAIGVKRYQDAILFYERIYKYYPEFPKRADALFMQAFVYDEHMKMKGKAADLYTQMIEKYPDHTMADDAAALRENLTLTEEELIRRFQQKNDSLQKLNP